MTLAGTASSRRVRSLLLLCALAVGLAGRIAVAEAAPRVAVVGDDAAVVTLMTETLRAHADVEVVTVSAPPVVDEQAVAALAAASELNAVVTVRVSVDGAIWTATVVAYEGKEGFVIGRYEVKAPVVKLASAAAAPLWKKLGAALTVAEAAPAAIEPPVAAGGTTVGPAVTADPEPAGPGPTEVAGPAVDGPPAGADPTTTEPAGADPTGAAAATGIVKPVAPRAGRSAVRIGASLQPFHRRLRYTDDIRDAMRSHDLTVAAVGVDGRWRPLAGLPIELTGAVQLSLGGSSAADASTMKYDTRATEWSLHAGYGVAAGPASLVARVGYGQQTFRIADDSQAGAEQVPDVDYRWVRVAADATVRVTARLRFEAGFGYRYILETGDLFGPAWFPRGTGNAVDGAVGVRVALKPRLDLFARADLRHYFFGMNPVLGDDLIVGGALDTYVGGSIGASLAAF